jgi:YidC/Oxa1 family membrane protein insertase
MLVIANIFQPLIDIFEAVLKFFHNSIGVPWGWSIVLLTVAVRACLIPLTIKQFSSMARMQLLQPEMKEIQKKYKEDKQRQQQEIMKFYKENKVNPLGSCLPMVAQLPVFISLYYMLRQSLRADICPGLQPKLASGLVNLAKVKACGPHGGAGFLFISDITNKAAGATLVVLIILYVGTQLSSSLMMSGATMDPTQRKIMLFMPLLFVLFVIRFPAGVLVYWITTNTWTIGQQYIVRRRIGPLRAAAATAGAAGSTSVVASPRSGPSNGAGKAPANGAAASSGGGLAGLIRSKVRPEVQKTPVATGGRGGPPPKSPRKKKKRSGRRR